jgi:hypothetical protein
VNDATRIPDSSADALDESVADAGKDAVEPPVREAVTADLIAAPRPPTG